MNQVITIPRSITQKGELVVIPRKEYERFLRFKVNGGAQRSKKSDPHIRKSLQELRQGRAIGPFKNAQDLLKSLRP